jgi:transcriptional regulator with XRE-family HTH domain
MDKSIFSKDYAILLKHLREARIEMGLTQGELAERLGQSQSFVSKCERGERRIDVIELRYFCKSIGVSFEDFVQQLTSELD